MEPTKLVIVVYEEGIRDDVIEVLERQGISYYTRWADVQGAGETGPKHGDPIWPGLNEIMLLAVGESAIAPLVAELHEVRDSFPVRPGLRFIITDAVFI